MHQGPVENEVQLLEQTLIVHLCAANEFIPIRARSSYVGLGGTALLSVTNLGWTTLTNHP